MEARNDSLFRRLLITRICLPFLHKFISSLVGKSSETLHVEVPYTSKQTVYGGRKENNNNNNAPSPVTLTIVRPLAMFWSLLLDAKLGLGESYMDGDWKASPNPTQLLNLFIRAKKESSRSSRSEPSMASSLQRLLLEAVVGVVRRAAAAFNYVQHRLRDNSIIQSAKNIEDHYDLGNEMFKLFLDPSMTYSCALFEDPADPVKGVDMVELEKAQFKKMDRLIDMLELGPDDHVLEIGCGWGATAIRAVQRSGCRWTGLTISKEQLAFGQQKVEEAGLSDKVQLLYQDYRLATGQYSRVISVEMIEAVGEAFLPQYFQVISDRLAPGGKAVLQAIICPDAYYERYCKSSDFIKKHIFPGGHMPSIGAIQKCLPADLAFGQKDHVGRHYAKTLDYWFAAWMEREPQLRTLGLSERFHRKWQFYFCLCSSLFANDHIDVIQFNINKQTSI